MPIDPATATLGELQALLPEFWAAVLERTWSSWGPTHMLWRPVQRMANPLSPEPARRVSNSETTPVVSSAPEVQGRTPRTRLRTPHKSRPRKRTELTLVDGPTAADRQRAREISATEFLPADCTRKSGCTCEFCRVANDVIAAEEHYAERQN
jgi:hypothetical protein